MDCRETDDVSVLLLLSKTQAPREFGVEAGCEGWFGEGDGLEIPVISSRLKPSTSSEPFLDLGPFLSVGGEGRSSKHKC